MNETEGSVKNTDGQTAIPGAQMPLGMRIVVSAVLFVLALWFFLNLANMYYTDTVIFLSKGTVEATVVQKSEAKTKNGKRYYVTYVFTVNEREYSRTALFGLLNKKTRLTQAQYDALESGSPLEVVYSKLTPAFNRYYDDKFKDDSKIWLILGMLAFGAISVNEFRSLIRRKKDGTAA